MNVAEETNAAGKVIREQEFEKFETYEAAEAFYNEKRAEGRQVSRGKQIENLREVSGVSTTFVAQVEDLIGELGAVEPRGTPPGRAPSASNRGLPRPPERQVHRRTGRAWR